MVAASLEKETKSVDLTSITSGSAATTAKQFVGDLDRIGLTGPIEQVVHHQHDGKPQYARVDRRRIEALGYLVTLEPAA